MTHFEIKLKDPERVLDVLRVIACTFPHDLARDAQGNVWGNTSGGLAGLKAFLEYGRIDAVISEEDYEQYMDRMGRKAADRQ